MRKYKFNNPITYRLFIPEMKGMYFTDSYFMCVGGDITIIKGYAWDGCTLAPDYPETKTASMVHDALYQYGNQLNLSRKVADKVFRRLLKEKGFKHYNIYYAGVRVFGWLFY